MKTSLIEWPGKISSLLFVPGCNFRCPFCHNADLVDPDRIKKLPDYSEQSVLEDLKKRRKWIDGVVVSGGEPTLNSDLPSFLKKLKKLGLVTMVQTNGSRPRVMSQLLKNELVDFFSLDFKVSWEKYSQVSQDKTSPKKVKQSLSLLLRAKIPFEVRTTVVPTIHDQKELLKMAQQLKKIVTPNSPLTNWYLQNFQPKNCLDPSFKKIRPYLESDLEMFLRKIKPIFPQTLIRS